MLILGIGAQWIAWRFRFPSILLLLLAGFIAGPITGFLDPDALLGDSLISIVSLSVGLILYEGGLSLRFADIPGLGRVVINLITLGLVITWVILAWAANTFLGLEFKLAILLGAILTVSGPTVIIPLLRDVRPKAPLGSILRWEGILIDPVGALMAVLVFEAILGGNFNQAPEHIFTGLLKTVLLGGGVGALGAFLLIFVMRRYLVPDFLQNSISLTLVIFVFAISNTLHAESGLFAVTLMGVIVANRANVTIRHIVEFKENLQVLLIGFLFITLSARLKLEQLSYIDSGAFIFLFIAVFFARPLAVFASTFGSSLSWQERAFLAWIAPRGIVAAAVASLFSIELGKAGFEQADIITAMTFFIIVGAGTVSGLTARPVARMLGVLQGQPQGLLMLGANKLCRSIAKYVKDAGYSVLLVDTNWANISAARTEGFETYYGNILSEYFIEEVDLDGIGRLFAMTPNDEANSLASLRLIEHFGRAEVYQLPLVHYELEEGEQEEHPMHLRGRFLFSAADHYYHLNSQMNQGAEVVELPFTSEDEYLEHKQKYEETFIPLLSIGHDQGFEVFTTELAPRPREGQKLVALVRKK